jgi:hypothetical protein
MNALEAVCVTKNGPIPVPVPVPSPRRARLAYTLTQINSDRTSFGYDTRAGGVEDC